MNEYIEIAFSRLKVDMRYYDWRDAVLKALPRHLPDESKKAIFQRSKEELVSSGRVRVSLDAERKMRILVSPT